MDLGVDSGTRVQYLVQTGQASRETHLHDPERRFRDSVGCRDSVQTLQARLRFTFVTWSVDSETL